MVQFKLIKIVPCENRLRNAKSSTQTFFTEDLSTIDGVSFKQRTDIAFSNFYTV